MAGDLYLVQDNDTLTSIAEKVCGDAKLADALAAMNRIEDPNHVYSGVQLIIDCEALKNWSPESQPFTPGPNPDGTYG
jgi:hypothetical protein